MFAKSVAAGLFALALSCTAATAIAADVVEVDTANYQKEIIDTKLPVVVEYYTQDCESCKQELTIITKLAAEFAGKVKFVRIDVEKSPGLASQIQPVPARIYLPDECEKHITDAGFATEQELRILIQRGLHLCAPASRQSIA